MSKVTDRWESGIGQRLQAGDRERYALDGRNVAILILAEQVERLADAAEKIANPVIEAPPPADTAREVLYQGTTCSLCGGYDGRHFDHCPRRGGTYIDPEGGPPPCSACEAPATVHTAGKSYCDKHRPDWAWKRQAAPDEEQAPCSTSHIPLGYEALDDFARIRCCSCGASTMATPGWEERIAHRHMCPNKADKDQAP